MNDVFVLMLDYGYEGEQLIGVVSTRTAAEMAVSTASATSGGRVNVYPVTVDAELRARHRGEDDLSAAARPEGSEP